MAGASGTAVSKGVCGNEVRNRLPMSMPIQSSILSRWLQALPSAIILLAIAIGAGSYFTSSEADAALPGSPAGPATLEAPSLLAASPPETKILPPAQPLAPADAPSPRTDPLPAPPSPILPNDRPQDLWSIPPLESLPSAAALEAIGHSPRVVTAQDIVTMVLERNLDIQIRAVGIEIAEAQIQQARGNFDPSFTADYTKDYNKNTQNAEEFVATGGSNTGTGFQQNDFYVDDNYLGNVGINGSLPIGMEYEIGLKADELDNTLIRNDPNNFFDPEYQSFPSLTFTQHLLRDFGTDINLTGIRVARINRKLSTLELKQALLKSIVETLTAYDELIYAHAELQTRREEVELVRRLVRESELQIERGLVSRRQLGEAINEYAKSADKLILSEKRRVDAQGKIFRLAGDAEHWQLSVLLVPKEEPPKAVPVFNVHQMIATAMRERPDYLTAVQKAERSKLEVRFAKNQTYPKVDIVTTLGLNALEGDYLASIDNAFEADAPRMSIGIVVDIPWGNHEAKGRLREAENQGLQALLEIKKVENTIVHEVREGIYHFEAQQRRLGAAIATREHFEREIEQEDRRMERGQATLVDTIAFRKEYYDAKVREWEIRMQVDQALLQLGYATGTLLPQFSITIEE
jgi:outer membrane protein TolC